MVGYRLSRRAERRLTDIYEYSLLTFGETQADLYFGNLHKAFELLQKNPALGRITKGRPGMRSFVHRRHTIFYVMEMPSILIFDILGPGQDVSRFL